ncbi:bifunctional hydroxymethylpyrimidine kinase/phosphomethylpyrimidine kinase [Bacteroides sp. 51]|uniref:bifunctional hydroxymethylpyrimidine kinase/phosphomethylpyrimidine kinase n=1 Tax=Bacteroides sp. 51 TaxID=2302938 RepID=UPI0013D1C358|nr:bifunctional hydroxymethylpyrimidine kinase/phosphomethylpyrimidine kinase [Bacteroides sp. 51]NDV83352.1 bifunctional hydroxymethylpyrimidine kinase/phosphomethylpyrimidine kinase [Bacteroides sp. 51]
MKRYPIVFSISGTDTIGGAGSQADIKTISALGVYAASAVTAITVRNTTGLKAIFRVPQESIKEQIEAVMEDIIPDIVKLGLLNDVETIRTVADCVRKYHPQYVVYDPIILAPDGERFMTDEVNKAIEKELIPFVNLVVLNRREAELLTGIPINNIANIRHAAEVFTQKYNISVLIKGGNLQENNIYDILRTPADEEWIYSDSIVESRNRHGAGCTFSAAISSYLALGSNLNEAVSQARDFVRDAIIHGKDVFLGSGEGPVCHNFAPTPMTYLCHETQKAKASRIPFEL